MSQSISIDYAMAAAWNPEKHTISEQFAAASGLYGGLIDATYGVKSRYEQQQIPVPDLYDALIHVLEQMDHSDAYRKKMGDVRDMITKSIVRDPSGQGSLAQRMMYWHQLSKQERIRTAQSLCHVITDPFRNAFDVYDHEDMIVCAGSSTPVWVETYSAPEQRIVKTYFPFRTHAARQSKEWHALAQSMTLNMSAESGFDDPLDTMNTIFDAVYREISKAFTRETATKALYQQNNITEDIRLIRAMVLDGPELPPYYQRAEDAHIMTRFIKEQQTLLRQDVFDAVEANLAVIPPLKERARISKLLGLIPRKP